MNDQGISIIIADSVEEVEHITRILGIEKPSMLKSFESMVLLDPDTVFYSILRTKSEMQRLIKYFNVKRGVMSCNGSRELVGYNLDWTKRILSMNRVDRVPVMHMQEEDREDPYASLGYRR